MPLPVAAPSLLSRDPNPPEKIPVCDEVQVLPFVSEGIRGNEGSNTKETTDRCHDNTNITDDKCLLKQICEGSKTKVKSLEAQIHENKNVIDELRQTIEQNRRDHEEKMAEQKEVLMNKDSDMRNLTHLNTSLNQSLTALSRACKDMRQAFLLLGDQIREEKEEQANVEKKDKMKINKLEKELRETKELCDRTKTALDKMTKESILETNMLKTTISELRDMSKFEDSAHLLETNYKATISKLRDELSKQTLDNENLQVHCPDMRARMNKFKRNAGTKMANVTRRLSPQSQTSDQNVFFLDEQTADVDEDDVKDESLHELTIRESTLLLSQVKWPQPEIFHQSDIDRNCSG